MTTQTEQKPTLSKLAVLAAGDAHAAPEMGRAGLVAGDLAHEIDGRLDSPWRAAVTENQPGAVVAGRLGLAGGRLDVGREDDADTNGRADRGETVTDGGKTSVNT